MFHESQIVLPLAARTATITAAGEQQNGLFAPSEGMHLVIVGTAKTATPSIVPTIEGKDALGNWYTILTGAAITDTGTTVLKVFPGASPVANAVANDHMPPTWRLTMTAGDSDSLTYSVTASFFGS